MSDITATGAATISALFESKDHAEDAVTRLIEAGLPQSSVTLMPGYESDSGVADREVHKGFFESLADFFMPAEDRHSYAEGLRRGGYLVTATTVPQGLYDTALDILDDEGAINLDEREETWRSEGWGGYDADAEGYSQTSADYVPTSNAATLGDTDEEVVPVIQEELRIGKRDVNHGRVRVRSYVTEEPVTEQLSLREETVRVERRPVNREIAAGDYAFEDRTIEAEEHSEEAVVEKRARVVEEVSLRKDSTSREETISDTVKRTDVEIEDERTLVDRKGTARR